MASLPGIDEHTTSEELITGDNEWHKLVIPKGSDWQIDLKAEGKLIVKVNSGIVEIFGTELAVDDEYTFQNWKFPIYAVEETELLWKCPDLTTNTITVKPNHTMKYIYNLHFMLEKIRMSNFEGPRVVIVGGSQTGKTSLSRTLCSYALKFNAYQPLYINLDPQQPIFTVPGCISATPISDILDAQLPTWGQSLTSGATLLHNKQPMVKNFGLERINENKDLYLECISQLGQVVGQRLHMDPQVRRSGCIVDTPSISQLDENLAELHHIIEKLNVNIMLVLCSETDPLWEKVKKTFGPELGNNNIFFIPKLDGVSAVDDVYKRSLQRTSIREYFYGSLDTALSPYAIGVDYEDLTIWKPSNVFDNEVGRVELFPVTITPSNLQHAIIAITFAERRADQATVIKSPILGFALITEVNEKRRKLRVLLPVPGRLPSKAMILTSYRYLE
ncbi:BAQ_1a_G0051200.mRNA.1.CDS.1 [Saccharomyces cerevisiae]|nr:Clp1p [Saccharomyces cerevisiae YJM451]AJT88824.1 Clp1p [Saccharomyces cerevisiae YJM1190]AJT94120.1 Clp1p [Saccharomyces cerevisiae YJM1307]AJU02933.1 Clp1p [Saccharomyces cerevisiae YJM1400]AJU03426.1 Clp1p [Saccharomyces cerevisiae YJM1401]AJU05404.1 Clp1p [Saccharomyces cerevisiae YJM1418]AJU07836.1 Clp1p [Saccharomyces cerevisiae YJM1443]AJU08329.1 Clp1p [Saccharomyces cerevisiae YJM1444]AJU11727.1 Clp1p [Saccharomyces cerevisiae YJM1479]CAD6646576.1 BJ4_G0037240.mRNA.1.CDS.1 [Sacc